MAELPWYELDRLILTAIGPVDWQYTRLIVEKVGRQCEGSGISDEEIFQRMVQMDALGILWVVSGDEALWRTYGCLVRQDIDE